MARKNMNKKVAKQREKVEIIKRFNPRVLLSLKTLYFLVAVALILLTYIFFKNLPYFQVKSVEVVDKTGSTQLDTVNLLKLYKGRNIFSVDIAALSSRITDEYPAIKDAIVKKVLPNRIEINVVSRVPIAKLGTRGSFFVDKEGVVLSPSVKTEKLPEITGLSAWSRIRIGENLKSKHLKNAIVLLKALGASPLPGGFTVASIDASNYRNLSIYLENGIEVKMGGENFASRLKMLTTALANPALDTDNIKYIDLRFKGVVIGPK